MSSLPIRDQKKDHLLTPENSTLIVIDYQPQQMFSVVSTDKYVMVKNVVALINLAKLYKMPIVVSTVGVGAGQMSRIDSVKIGAMRAQLPVAGSVLASDAFFPFRDGVDEAAKHGITAVIQPGGSVRDEDAIAAADRLGLAMAFTGVRHFRH